MYQEVLNKIEGLRQQFDDQAHEIREHAIKEKRKNEDFQDVLFVTELHECEKFITLLNSITKSIQLESKLESDMQVAREIAYQTQQDIGEDNVKVYSDAESKLNALLEMTDKSESLVNVLLNGVESLSHPLDELKDMNPDFVDLMKDNKQVMNDFAEMKNNIQQILAARPSPQKILQLVPEAKILDSQEIESRDKVAASINIFGAAKDFFEKFEKICEQEGKNIKEFLPNMSKIKFAIHYANNDACKNLVNSFYEAKRDVFEVLHQLKEAIVVPIKSLTDKNEPPSPRLGG